MQACLMERPVDLRVEAGRLWGGLLGAQEQSRASAVGGGAPALHAGVVGSGWGKRRDPQASS